MKRLTALLLMGLIMISMGGCSFTSEETDAQKEGRTYYAAPTIGNYEVEYEGRVYTTRGTPFCYGEDNGSFADALGKKLGDTESVGGTFPKGTTYYFFDTEQYMFKSKQVLLAMLPGEEIQYYIAFCCGELAVHDGGDLLSPLFLKSNCRQFYIIDQQDPTRMWSPDAVTDEQKDAFIMAVEKAEPIDVTPKGKPLTFMMMSYDGVVVQFDLYEDGVLVLMLSPDTPLQLSMEMDQWIRQTFA